jgi:hypothetical protein
MINILYIAGPARSGSTIVGNLLGQADGLFHIGEATSLWQMGLDRDASCGCGKLLKNCSVWEPVLHRAFGGIENIDRRSVAKARRGVPRSYKIPFITSWNEDSYYEKYEHYLSILKRFYGSVAHVTQCEWIVDSSKIPSLAYLLEQARGIRVYVLHLIRDPRAILYSWKRKAIEGFTVKPTKNLAGWNSRNAVIEFLRYKHKLNYLRLRYEDFAASPESSIQEILHFIGRPDEDLHFISNSQARMKATHTIWGNPKRSKRGSIDIIPDDAWRFDSPSHLKTYATLASWPLMLRYDYL